MHLSAPPSAPSSADTAELSVTTAPLDAAAVLFDGGSHSVQAVADVLRQAFPEVPVAELLHWNPQHQRLQLLDLFFKTWNTVIPGHWVVVHDRGVLVLHPDLFHVLFRDQSVVQRRNDQLLTLREQIGQLSADLHDALSWVDAEVSDTGGDPVVLPTPRAEDRLTAEHLAPAATFHVNGVAMYVGDVYRDWTGTAWTVTEASPDGIWCTDGVNTRSWSDLLQHCSPLVLEIYNGRHMAAEDGRAHSG